MVAIQTLKKCRCEGIFIQLIQNTEFSKQSSHSLNRWFFFLMAYSSLQNCPDVRQLVLSEKSQLLNARETTFIEEECVYVCVDNTDTDLLKLLRNTPPLF